MNKLRCQSCGMPLSFPLTDEFFGTHAEGAKNKEYCQFCFQKGQFTKPHLTKQEMVNTSIDHMITELRFPREKAERLAHEIIPHLRRWNT